MTTLRDEARQLYSEAASMLTRADTLQAQAEITDKLTEASASVLATETEMQNAVAALRDATAAYEPLANDLAATSARLAQTAALVSSKDLGSLPLAERVAAQRDLAGWEMEHRRLTPIAAEAQAAVRAADERVTTLTESLAWFLAEQDRTTRLAGAPPMGDLAELSELAPMAATFRADRLALMTLAIGDLDGSESHLEFLKKHVMAMLGRAGLIRGIREQAFRDVGKWPRKHPGFVPGAEPTLEGARQAMYGTVDGNDLRPPGSGSFPLRSPAGQPGPFVARGQGSPASYSAPQPVPGTGPPLLVAGPGNLPPTGPGGSIAG